MTKLIFGYFGALTFEPDKNNWRNGASNTESRCLDDWTILIDEDRCSIYIEETWLVFNDKQDKLSLEGEHTLPCLHLDSFFNSAKSLYYCLLSWRKMSIFTSLFLWDACFNKKSLLVWNWYFSQKYWRNTARIIRSISLIVFQFSLSPLRAETPTLSRLEISPQNKRLSVKNPQQRKLFTKWVTFFVTHTKTLLWILEKIYVVVNEEPAFFTGSLFPPLDFDSFRNTFSLSSLNISSRFGTVDYEAHINTQMDCLINLVFNHITMLELKTCILFVIFNEHSC